MVESPSKESYVEVVVRFREVYRNFPKFHSYVEKYHIALFEGRNCMGMNRL